MTLSTTSAQYGPSLRTCRLMMTILVRKISLQAQLREQLHAQLREQLHAQLHQWSMGEQFREQLHAQLH